VTVQTETGDQRPAAGTLYVVLNAGSGHEDADEAAGLIARHLTQAGRHHEFLRVGEGVSVEQAAREAVRRARSANGVVVAAGGDGTLNAVARATLGSGCAFGVIPQGTFNYFARAHSIPTDTAEATEALLNAHIQPVRVGTVNDRLFLVNASVGLYPETLDVREEQKHRHGRHRIVALWATLLTILRGHRPMRIRLVRDEGVQDVWTLTLFVSINPFQLQKMGLSEDEALADERLTAIVLKPVSTARLLWLVAKGALGRLIHDRRVDTFRFTHLTVAPAGPRVRRVKVAMDGETSWVTPPLDIRFAPDRLMLLVPGGSSRGET
jgi:diacylglycerol kinase family enzyme